MKNNWRQIFSWEVLGPEYIRYEVEKLGDDELIQAFIYLDDLINVKKIFGVNDLYWYQEYIRELERRGISPDDERFPEEWRREGRKRMSNSRYTFRITDIPLILSYENDTFYLSQGSTVLFESSDWQEMHQFLRLNYSVPSGVVTRAISEALTRGEVEL